MFQSYMLYNKRNGGIRVNRLNFLGMIVLLTFYGSYYAKLLLQSIRGIKTDRMGKGSKSRKTFVIEIALKTTTFLTAGVQFISIVFIEKLPIIMGNYLIRYSGIIVSLLGVMVFIAAMSTMRDSWRAGIDSTQKTSIVKTGIYKYSRNPAFLGFDLFYIGMAITFSNVYNVVFAAMSILMLHLQILEEEKFLAVIFGEAYLDYKKKTGRYLGA